MMVLTLYVVHHLVCEFVCVCDVVPGFANNSTTVLYLTHAVAMVCNALLFL